MLLKVNIGHYHKPGGIMSAKSRFLTSYVVIFLTISGCSKAKLDPCSLLGVSEAQDLDSTISSSKAFPRRGAEKNDLCLFYNANGDRRLMLFVWTDPKTDPVNVVTSGMTASNSKIVEIPAVGDKAAAGFASGKLKLFTARNRKGMIGIRVREPIMQDDEKFDDVKALVATLLGRLK